MIQQNIAISEFFDSFAEGLDIFLVGRKVTERKNETSVRIENSTDVKERKKPHNSTGINVNLRLPNLEDYWQLKFTSYDESQERGVRRGYRRQSPREQNYGATVGLFRKFGQMKTSFSPRIALQNPLNVSHSLKFESVADLGWYEINPILEFFANPEKGTGIFFALNFNYELSSVYSVTWINESEYEEKRNLFSTLHGLALGQQITDLSSMSYDIFFDSISRPNYHLEVTTIQVVWNHILYKKILDYQVIPYLQFQYPSFRGTPGIRFNLNLNF